MLACAGKAGRAPFDGDVVIFFVSYIKKKKKREKGWLWRNVIGYTI